VRIDPTTNTIDRIVSLGDAFLSVFAPVAGNTNLVEAAGSVWAMDATNGEVIRLPLTAFKP
jgi:hypothetical protein